jgi:hypothetical protein
MTQSPTHFADKVSVRATRSIAADIAAKARAITTQEEKTASGVQFFAEYIPIGNNPQPQLFAGAINELQMRMMDCLNFHIANGSPRYVIESSIFVRQSTNGMTVHGQMECTPDLTVAVKFNDKFKPLLHRKEKIPT